MGKRESKNEKESERKEYLLSEYIDQKALHLAAGELCHQIKSNQIKSNQFKLTFNSIFGCYRIDFPLIASEELRIFRYSILILSI